jgi:hypothetical protein
MLVAYLIKHLYLSLYFFVASDFLLNLKSGVEFKAVFVALNKNENGVPCCAERVVILALRYLLQYHNGASRAYVNVISFTPARKSLPFLRRFEDKITRAKQLVHFLRRAASI